VVLGLEVAEPFELGRVGAADSIRKMGTEVVVVDLSAELGHDVDDAFVTVDLTEFMKPDGELGLAGSFSCSPCPLC